RADPHRDPRQLSREPISPERADGRWRRPLLEWRAMLNRASLPARFRSVTAGLLLSVLTLAPASAAQPAAAGVLLDITYYAQAPLHCGAAALAMVLRYWGHPSAVPADFSPLVDPAAGGITTTALATAAEDRGW